jgi:hypothetical protein
MEIKKNVRAMEITACPVCGSKNIGIGTLGDGIISGLSSWKEVCKNCGYQGASLLFETEEDYQKFCSALKEKSANGARQSTEDNIEEEPAEMTNEDKEVLSLLDETEDASSLPTKKSYVFEFICSLVLSIVFFVILVSDSFFGVNTFVFSNDLFSAALYLLGSFIGLLIFFFLLIVFVETIYRSIRRKKHT